MKIKLVKGHKYLRNGHFYTSVTTYINSFFKPFDADGIAKKLSKIPKYKALKQGVRYWKAKWKESREEGSLIHKEIDNFIKKIGTPEHNKSKNAIEYLSTLEYIDIETEKIVFSDEHKLAGTIDCILRTEDGIILLDWKSNEKISQEAFSNEKGIKHPVLNIPDSNYWHYALQLNMYAYILSKIYNEKIIGMRLIHLQDDGIVAYDIPEMFDLVNEMLEVRK